MTHVLLERRDDTAVLIFARPPANAFDLALVTEIDARVHELAAAPPAGGVVVTGDGPMFSGGVDFKAVPRYSADERARMIGHINRAITGLYALPTATVAAVNGHAIGGAFVVVLACDVRLAADVDATYALTEVTAGIPYPACPMEVVLAELDANVRRHLVLSGDAIDPRGALARGIVDELMAPDDLVARAVALARTRAAARSYARVKEQLRGGAIARMRAIVSGGSDPMLAQWL